jgi:uncharacterized alkaline shock family protein YloU
MNPTALDHSDEPLSSPEESAATKQVEAGAREESGRLDVAHQVVEKVAGHAVTLVAGAAAAPRRVLGVNVGEARPEDAASVTAEVHDGMASVQVTIAVSWPKSVQAVAEEVRRRIRAEVTSLTGLRVDHVDVEVVSMTVPESAEPRVR